MEVNKPGRKFVARWDESVVVDVYKDGDFRLVVQNNGTFQVLSERVLPGFFRPAPELDTKNRTDSEVEPDGQRT